MTTQLSIPEAMLDFLLISDFNLSNLAALLSKDEESLMIRATAAPFGQVMQLLLEPASELWSKGTQGAVVWTSPEGVSPSYRRLLDSEEVEPEELLREVDEFCNSIKAIPGSVKYIFVPSWILGPFARRAGLLDMDPRHGASLALMRMNLRLVEGLKNDSRIVVLDAARWVAVHGEKAFSRRLWYMSKTPYTTEFFNEAVLDIKAAIRALSGQAKKLIVVDLDDTMWGGIVGDVGWPNIRLGRHDAAGEAFRDFQLGLKLLKQRGVMLGIVSKNEESVALEAIRSHPEMVLREDDFAGWRINWEDKAQNIVDLVAELNLGLQSVVFIDDNPVERARVRQALPEVFVPEWPANIMDRKAALMQLRCFDVPLVSAEDLARTNMYFAERKRRIARTEAPSLEQWLESLEMKVVAEPLSQANLHRAAQLFNKTNQMNLSTRRLTKDELWSWSRLSTTQFLTFKVSDRFGDYGLVGLCSFSRQPRAKAAARIVDFLLSCRVMGRRIEEVMFHVLTEYAKGFGCLTLSATYIATDRNAPCLKFLTASGLTRQGDTFHWDLEHAYPPPCGIEVIIPLRKSAFTSDQSDLVGESIVFV